MAGRCPASQGYLGVLIHVCGRGYRCISCICLNSYIYMHLNIPNIIVKHPAYWKITLVFLSFLCKHVLLSCCIFHKSVLAITRALYTLQDKSHKKCPCNLLDNLYFANLNYKSVLANARTFYTVLRNQITNVSL